jgi:U3 small nucleolar RNA-associated protein 20
MLLSSCLAYKFAAGLMKCPLKNLPKSVPVFILQMISIICQTGNTESRIVQVTFQSLAAILHNLPDAQVKEEDFIFLLEPLALDSRSMIIKLQCLWCFVPLSFVGLSLKFMDKVSEIMVTNQSPQVQELCRSVLL